MTNRARIGIVLLLLLGAGVLTRISDHAGVPPRKAEPVPMAGMIEGQPDFVDLITGNLHLEISILTTHRKPTAPRSRHRAEYVLLGVPVGPGRAIRERVSLQAGTLIVGTESGTIMYSCPVCRV